MKSIIFYKKVTSSFHSNRWMKVRGSGIISTSRTQQKFLGVSTCVILINYLIVIKSNLLSKLRFVDVTLCLLLVSMIRCVSIQCIYPWITREFGYMQRRLRGQTCYAAAGRCWCFSLIRLSVIVDFLITLFFQSYTTFRNYWFLDCV